MRSADVVGCILAVVLALSAWVALDKNGSPELHPEVLPPPTCEASRVWSLPNGAETDFFDEGTYSGNTVLRGCASSPGILSVRLRGSTVAGIGAQVVIALGTTNLWEGFVTDPIELELDVPHAGTMLIAFVNDRYEPPEDRNLWISDVVFTPR